jgi:uncharacterized membrane protein YhaH (DUF805 family)
MRGNVIGFDPDTNTGAISGHDGQRYDFTTQDWHARNQPRHGDVIDFQVGAAQRAQEIYLIEGEYVPPTLGQFLLSSQGRISRSQYWLKWALPMFVVTIVIEIVAFTALPPAGAGVLMGIYGLLLLWPSIAIYIKRAHDRDWPWAFILLMFVPLVQFWPLIEFWFLRGTIGSNRFGPDPVPHS